jgi:hypothetical protein
VDKKYSWILHAAAGGKKIVRLFFGTGPKHQMAHSDIEEGRWLRCYGAQQSRRRETRESFQQYGGSEIYDSIEQRLDPNP